MDKAVKQSKEIFSNNYKFAIDEMLKLRQENNLKEYFQAAKQFIKSNNINTSPFVLSMYNNNNEIIT
jgi:hypothetical protein